MLSVCSDKLDFRELASRMEETSLLVWSGQAGWIEWTGRDKGGIKGLMVAGARLGAPPLVLEAQ